MDSDSSAILKKISKYLTEEFNVEALILCGSRYVGDYKKHSDWDVKAFVRNPQDISRHKQPPRLDGIDLECTFHSIHTHFSWEEFGLKLRFSGIVFDNEEQSAKRVRDQAHSEYAKGPKKWSAYYALGRIERVKRYEQKFRDCLESNNHHELFQRIAWHFLENTYTWWYGVRGEWEPRPQQIFEDIKKRDPQFYSYLEIIFTSTNNEQKVAAFRDLHKYFFASEEFQKIIQDD